MWDLRNKSSKCKRNADWQIRIPFICTSFLYLWVKIHESVSSFSKSNPYRRITKLVHLLPMFWDTKWRKLPKLEPTEEKTILTFDNPYTCTSSFLPSDQIYPWSQTSKFDLIVFLFFKRFRPFQDYATYMHSAGSRI